MTDADLIREAIDFLRASGFENYAKAIEERGAQLEQERAEARRQGAHRDAANARALAAEQERDRLREALQTLLDAQQKYTDRPDWMYACDKARAALSATCPPRRDAERQRRKRRTTNTSQHQSPRPAAARMEGSDEPVSLHPL